MNVPAVRDQALRRTSTRPRRGTIAARVPSPGLILSAVALALVVLAAFRPRLFTGRDPLQTAPAQMFRPPSDAAWLGTDELGRDMYARLVYGAGPSLRATMIAVAIAFVVGGGVGLVAGFVGRWVDDLLMRVVDVLLAVPALLLSLALVTALGYGTVKIAIAVGMASVAGFARVMRAEVVRLRQAVFVEAAWSCGVRWYSIVGRHVLPHAIGPVLALALSLIHRRRPWVPGQRVVDLHTARTDRRDHRAGNQSHRPRTQPRTDRGTMTTPLLDVRDLHVSYRLPGHAVPAVRGVDLTVQPGEIVAVVGESGSGKTTLAQAIIGLLPHGGHLDAGEIRFGGHDLATLPERRLRHIRGMDIGMIPQDPAVSLNPVRRIGTQVAEVLRIHGLADRRTAAAEAIGLLERAGLSDPITRAHQYPHELSGGMKQRVLIAIAIAAAPQLIIADEPTSALDVTVQRRILDHIQRLAEQSRMAVLLVTHDLGVVADRADRVMVMAAGRIMESGPTRDVLGRPSAPETRLLLDSARAEPRVEPVAPATNTAPLVEVEHLAKHFPLPRSAGSGPTTTAVDDVSFTIHRGETVALVGESGSGKTTIARMMAHLLAPTSGLIRYAGMDATRSWPREMRRRVQMVYQNPYSSLDHRFSVEQLITEPLRAFRVGSRAERRTRAQALLDQVALPTSLLERRPAELSGGQRQRVAIARALALSPELVICDEPVSALDPSVQDQILRLLAGLQTEIGMAYLFISHDLAAVRQVAHRVAILRAGRIVEIGPTEQLFASPDEQYTRELIAAIPGRPLRLSQQDS